MREIRGSAITAASIQAGSFGMSKEEAEKRTVFILLKRDRMNPNAVKEYSLVFQDEQAADAMCGQMNAAKDGRWVFTVLETVFSGPFESR